ncbi:efflux transporter outer membrane subunit [Undibacterium sp. SXout20W]|uniref:efflux transporter outer membrane subunit n=1 Tax=Undibacterium sp. SXout20W TaxID=3413051 RepID=UPI003BF03F60
MKTISLPFMKLKPTLLSVALLGVFTAGVGSLSGCAVGPDYQRPAQTLPESYLATTTNNDVKASSDGNSGNKVESQKLVPGRDIPAEWWELFHNQALNELVIASLKNNPTIDAAKAALRAAKEARAAQEAAFFPSVSASYSPTRQRVAKPLASPAASGATYYNVQTAEVSVSYTIDVFGANKRQVESESAQQENQRLQLEAAYLTLASNITNAAIQEAMLRGQISATKEVIRSQKQLLEMFERQLTLGQLGQADLAAQEAALAASEAQLPPLEKQLSVQRDLILALAGRYPNETGVATFELDELQLPSELPLSLPSKLIDQRPDVRAAEEQMHAASAAIGAAIANRLPNFTIGATSYGSAAENFSDLFKASGAFWNLAANITQPIFDGGALKHKQAVAQAVYDQAAAQYRSIVLGAFQNVADSLQAIQYDNNAYAAAYKSEQASLKSVTIARKQFALGDISTASLLVAEQTYQQAKSALVQAQANRLSDTVALIQSLGGGWMNKKETSDKSKLAS